MSTIHVPRDTTQVSARAGDTVEVRLDEPAATGYQWAVLVTGDGIAEAYSTLQVVEDGSVVPGAGAVRLVGLRAERPGVHDVSFELRRPWEVGLSPLERRSLQIEVAD